MQTNRSAPPATVTPVLVYPDVRAAVAWLEAAFGFEERVRIGETHRAQLRVGLDGAIVVADVASERIAPDATRRFGILPTLMRATSWHLAASMIETSSPSTLLTQQYLPSGLNVSQVGPCPVRTLPMNLLLAVSNTYTLSVPQLVNQNSFSSGVNVQAVCRRVRYGELHACWQRGQNHLRVTLRPDTSTMTKPCRSTAPGKGRLIASHCQGTRDTADRDFRKVGERLQVEEVDLVVAHRGHPEMIVARAL